MTLSAKHNHREAPRLRGKLLDCKRAAALLVLRWQAEAVHKDILASGASHLLVAHMDLMRAIDEAGHPGLGTTQDGEARPRATVSDARSELKNLKAQIPAHASASDGRLIELDLGRLGDFTFGDDDSASTDGPLDAGSFLDSLVSDVKS